ncbi:MAG TPA: D-alanyl-D-alanine carboxypeptidase/D-alanyl-D-alanine-endopeptidase [Porticoccaceae bacterium]|nr:D-alanyl-D-alanine carboxypeptidase/D-alanyl-D-alanine-endopeptidase [Porticoccaceae bacterium]
MKLAALALWLLTLCWPALADEAALRALVTQSGLPRDSLSLLAVEQGPDGPRTRLSLNADRALIPASVTKLVTAAAVFREIPLGTRFDTRLMSAAPLRDGELHGDLVMEGRGDPSLVSETLWVLVNRLAQAGVTRIRGDIRVDASYFDDSLMDPSRDTRRSEMAYDAPVSALSFNWNALALTIAPGESPGAPARVHVEPPSDYLRVHNSARTVAGSGIGKLVASRRPGDDHPGDTLVVSGEIGLHADPFEGYRNITRPDLWTGANLKLYLGYRGIAVDGAVRPGPVPPGSRLLARVQGRPVEQLVVDMNKVSSNFIAEMLTKNLAARRAPPGTLAGGMAVLNGYMAALGLAPDHYQLTNPSGLTRQNRLSATALARVLDDMAGDFRVANEFLASLPIAGIDGTLENRMTATPARGWVRAKTGYIDGVVSLAGFAGRARGDGGGRVTFAFIYNGPEPAYRVRALFDRLSAALVLEPAAP